MLSYAIMFLIIALVAGVFGFVSITGQAALIGQILFFIFLVLSALALTTPMRRPPV